MTHAIRFHKSGGPEVLAWEEVQVGKPGPGEAKIRHTAVGLNFVDIYIRSGLYPAQLPSGLGGEDIALYWVDDAVYATHNVCTHAFARLSEGFLEGDCIECPIHQALFNVKTGEVVAPPAYDPVKIFPCRIEGDDVLVDV